MQLLLFRFRAYRLLTLVLLALFVTTTAPDPARAEDPTRDLTWFLRRMRQPERLAEIESSTTALASTWDRSGGNNDGKDFKKLDGPRNILLDVDGPGCIHRIFVGKLGEEVAGTRIQFFFDGADKPSIDMPVEKFFDDRHGPIPYPLVFHKTYPGLLLPIPYANHCRLQLFNEQRKNWGQFWQITYTTYPSKTPVQTMIWPPSPGEIQEMQAVGGRWLEAEKTPPNIPAKWTGEKEDLVTHGEMMEISWEKAGLITQWRVSCNPDAPEFMQQVRLQICWDGADAPSVDTPLGQFFGYAQPATGETRYRSLLMGIAGGEAYSCFPMPFRNGAKLRLMNQSDRPIKMNVRWDSEVRKDLPANWGRFHATYHAGPAGAPDSPRFGEKQVPGHLALETTGSGKYVGLSLQVIWPWPFWWGEGDWLIWSDQTDWPPRYHGTGSEEYFNSGWCKFDRKAISGYVATKATIKSVYTFHLNDAFEFEKNIRVAVETMGGKEGDARIAEDHPIWATTAFWYAPFARPAGSSQKVYLPGQLDYVRKALASQPASQPAASSSPATSEE